MQAIFSAMTFFYFQIEEGCINCVKCNGWIQETHAGIGEQDDDEEESVC
jgi:hypothetical protein